MGSSGEPFEIFNDPGPSFKEDGTDDMAIFDYARSLNIRSLIYFMNCSNYLKSSLAPHIYYPAAGDNWLGEEPLMIMAIKKRDMGALQLLWRNRPRTPQMDNAAKTALRVAVDVDNKEATQMLLEAGVDPGYIGRLPNEEDLTSSVFFGFPIYNAVQKGHLEILKLLMENNADYMRLEPIGMILAPQTVRWYLLEQAITETRLKVASYLLLDAPRPSVVPTNQGTRIFYDAVHRGLTEVVRFLCIHHEEISSSKKRLSRKHRRSRGYCRLDYRRHCLNFTHCSWQRNQTALHLVAGSYRKKNNPSHTVPMAEFLLVNGANVHAVNFVGKTALHIAALVGDHRLVATLLDHEANIDAVDFHGYTGVHCAIMAKRLSMVKVLLERGAAVDMADHSGQTPLHMAVTREEKAIEVLLLSYGATKPADLNPLSIELLESNFGTT